MKKIFILFVLLFLGLSVIAEEELYSKVFVTRFFHCFPTQRTYVDNDTMTQSIVGWWKDEKCRFNFKTKDEAGKPVQYNCTFTRSQVTQFAGAMKQDPYGTGAAKTMLDNFKKDENTCKKAN